MRQRRQRNGRAGTANGCNWNSEHRDRGHCRDRDLHLGAALIAGGVLLQAGILIDRFVAITFVIRVRKGHSWRLRSHDAGLCDADRLSEKHRCCDNAADCTTNSGTAKYHESLTSIEEPKPL